MADHKTEGILSSEILDGFIKVKKKKIISFFSFIYDRCNFVSFGKILKVIKN